MVPALGRASRLRTTCGSGYIPGVVYQLVCTAKSGSQFKAEMRAGSSGSLVHARVTARGDGTFTQSGVSCAVSTPGKAVLPGGVLKEVPLPEVPCSVSADVSRGEVVGLQLAGREVTITQVLGGRMQTGGDGGHVPRGTWAFEVTRGWSTPFSLQDLLSAPALRPSYNRQAGVAIVPSGSRAYRPLLVLDSACAEEVYGAAARQKVPTLQPRHPLRPFAASEVGSHGTPCAQPPTGPLSPAHFLRSQDVPRRTRGAGPTSAALPTSA